jgi:HlyD family secretion protein
MFLIKRKKTVIAIIIVFCLIGAVAYGQYKKSTAPTEYETVLAKRGDIKQTVEATGKIRSANDIKLRFEMAGTVGAVNVKEGDEVKEGDIIMTLKASDLDALVAQAVANLNQKLAGATKEDIIYYQSAVDIAKASLDAAKTDKEHAISAAELAVQNALNNLKLADGGENSVIVSNAYESAVSVLKSSISVIDNALTQADNILGVDNVLANDDFEQYLSLLDTSKLFIAKDYYRLVRDKAVPVRSEVSLININSSKSSIDQGLENVESILSDCTRLLSLTRDTLDATAPVGNLTQLSLDNKKTTIENARSSVSTQYNSVINSRQNIVTAKNSYSNYLIAYDKAQRDLDNVKKNAETNIAIKEASYNQALSNLNAKLNPPREVDLASYRASLAQAMANRAKAILKAPIDGVITKIYKKKGEFASITEMAANILSPYYEIEVDIPETDVVKLSIGNIASITLDAYGEDVKFIGKIISIEPASTVIQDVVYYKVIVAIDNSDKEIKPGMTANVALGTAEANNVIYIPSRSIRTDDDGNKFIKLLKDNQEIDAPVILGLRADNGEIEIVSGLNENDVVIIRVIEKK